MAQITLQGNPLATFGDLPGLNTPAPAFTLTGTDLTEHSLNEYAGKWVVLNIFPSIDTPVCATSVRRFNQEAAALAGTVILCISADLPFAHQRFCGAEGLTGVISLSSFRSPEFGRDYGVTITSPPLRGLLARAIVIIDPRGKVVYTQQVPEIKEEPEYAAALQALKS